MRHHLATPPLRAAAVLCLGLLLLAGCTSTPAGPATSTTPTSTAPAKQSLVLASTTSTQDSGLFSVLIPAFEKDNPAYAVKVIAVGSGEAMTLGQKKDADVLLVHSPAAEKSFIASGFGEARLPVMHNVFVVVGAPSDPAVIKGDASVVDAFKKIAAAGDAGKVVFVARGDDSGTAKKEESIWASATIKPKGQSWYLSTGQGMGEVLKLTSEKKGYTLTDEATYLSMKTSLQLDSLVAGDKKLSNPYSVIVVTGAKNLAGAKAFQSWILGPLGQAVIKNYGVDKFGKALFIPDAK